MCLEAVKHMDDVFGETLCDIAKIIVWDRDLTGQSLV